MIQDRKARAEALLRQLNQRRASAEVQLMIDYLALKVEESKDLLMAVATEDDFRRVQGQAATYDRLLTALTRAPLPEQSFYNTTTV